MNRGDRLAITVESSAKDDAGVASEEDSEL
jgi:hypothetical protein